MQRLQHVWNWIVIHKNEIWLALVFGLIIGIILDLISINSAIRGRIREQRNKWSEKSAGRLRERIQQLENDRDRFRSYLSSDKGLYLWMLGAVIGILLCMSLGVCLLIVEGIFIMFGAEVAGRWPYYFLSLLMFIIAIGLAVRGVKISSLDTKEKLAEYIEKLDAEIASLKAKL